MKKTLLLFSLLGCLLAGGAIVGQTIMVRFSTLTTKTNRGLRTLFRSTLWLLSLLPLSLWAQTFDVGKNTYAVNGSVSEIVTDNAGNTYVGGNFTTVGLWSGHGAKFSSTGTWDNTTLRVAGGSINAVVAIPTALGGGWYIGGTFTQINGQTRNRLARLNADGSLHAFDPNMDGTNPSVNALALNSSGELYVGGAFTTVGGSETRNNLCKFNSSGTLDTFDPNISGFFGFGSVNALALNSSGELYVGGAFTTVGGSETRNNLCKFNSSGTLDTFDPNIGGSFGFAFVNALALNSSGELYVGGEFTTVGSTTRNYLCKVSSSGTLDPTFDPNMDGNVRSLALNSSGELYVGGEFTTVGGSETRNRLCKFNSSGTLDPTFNPNMSASVNALVLNSSGDLYVGGAFNTVGGSTTRNRLCKFNSSGTLDAFDPNMGGSGIPAVVALALNSSGELYVGGSFTIVGSTTRNRLCKFNSSGTLDGTFDPNMNGAVLALALNSSGELYVGGFFTAVGGSTPRNRLCKFNSSGTLDAFNPNMGGLVRALALNSSGELYVGGDFTTVGGSTTRNALCKFSNSGTLDAFNPNVSITTGSASVLALALNSSGELYVGGDFTTVGGSTTRNALCKFSSSGMLDAFNSNMNGAVYALALNSSGELYVGGSFTTVGGSTTRNALCKFNSSGTLAAFDPNMSIPFSAASVRALALNSSGDLYVGGEFTTVGGSMTRNRLCKFNSNGTLDAFNPDVSSAFSFTAVLALALNSSGELMVGGDYTSPSPYFTVYTGAGTPVVVCFTPTAYTVTGTGAYCAGGTGVTVGLSNSETGVNYQLYKDASIDDTALSGTGSALSWANKTAGTYTVVATRTTGGCTATMTGSAEVTAVPNPTMANAGDDQTDASTCGFTQVTLAANTPTVGTGAWSVVTGTGGSFGDANSPTSTFSGTAGASYTLRWTVSNSPCAATDDVDITFNQTPTFSACPTGVTVNASSDCSATATYTATAETTTPASSIDYAFSGMTSGTGMGTGSGSSFNLGTTLVTLTATSNCGTSTCSFNVVVQAGFLESLNFAIVLVPGENPLDVLKKTCNTIESAYETCSNEVEPCDPQIIAQNQECQQLKRVLASAGAPVMAIVVQPDGKYLIAGAFSQVLGVARASIARINADGTLDNGFNASTNGYITSMARQTDGKIIIAGAFTTVNGTTGLSNIARLNADGSLDIAFNSSGGVSLGGTNQLVTTVAVQADGKILIGGAFTSVNNSALSASIGINNIARLNEDGTLDMNFNRSGGIGLGGTNDYVRSIAVQADGKILIGGTFTSVNGSAVNAGTGINRIARLNPDGSLDAAFNSSGGNGLGGANNDVQSIAVQPDGKILIGGAFTSVNGSAVSTSTGINRIARLNPDGSLDPAFNSSGGVGLGGANGQVSSIVMQPDGKILIGGDFSSVNGSAESTSTGINRIARLNADGSIDATFNSSGGVSLGGATGGFVTCMALLDDDKILLGGAFTAVNNTPRDYLAVLSNPFAAGPDQTDASTCGQTSVNLAAKTPTVGTGAWSVVTGTGGSFGDTSSPTSSFSGTAGATYTLRWTVTAACLASTDDVVITFNQNPTTANAGDDQTGASTCGLTQVTLAANTPSVGTGAWSVVTGTGGSFGDASSPTSTFSGTAGTTYTLRWTVSNSPCAASTDDVDITFNQNPTTANAGDDQTDASTCGLSQVTLAANTPTVGTGAWSVVTGTDGSFGDANSPTSTFSGTAGASYTLRWTVSNSPCAATDDVDITFNQTPTFSACPTGVTVNASSDCSATATYTATAETTTPASSIGYAFSGMTSGTGMGTGSGSSFNLGTTLVTLTATSTCGTSTCSFNVVVQAGEINVQGNSMTIGDGDNTPSTADHTDFGQTTGASIMRTFTVQNSSGSVPLAVSGIALGGANPGQFSVGVLTPASPIPPNSAATFTVTYAPNATGIHNATVTVTNGDCDESLYDFAIRGELTCSVPTFTACPTATVALNTPTTGCAAIANYTVTANGLPTPALSYAFTGATTGSGSGTGSGSTFNRGITTVTVTATNTCGAPTCVFSVAVTDNQPPSISCPNNRTVNADAGLCNSVQSYTVTASDNCAYTLTQTNGFASGSAFPLGLNVVNWKVTDAGGNATTCAFSITVLDAQAPTISCPGSSTVNASTGQCSAVVNYSVSGSDNCSGWSLLRTSGLQSGAQFPVGTTTVTWKNTDTGSNSTTCSFTVTVTESQLPNISCPANITTNAAAGLCSAIVNYATPTVSDNCSGASAMHVSGGTSGSSFNKGVNTIEWKATDAANNTKTCSFTITVNDTQAPTITCPVNITANTGAGTCAAIVTFGNATATDNCTPPPTVAQTSGQASGSSFAKGLHTLTFRATDGAGLTKACSFRITVVDNVLPTITCPSNIVKNTDNNLCTSVTNYSVTGADNCSSVSVSRISGLASGSAFPRGSSTVIWRATDLAGNSTLCSFTVTVNDAQLPGISCPANINTTTAAGQCNKTVFYTNPTATDNCTGSSANLFSGLASGSVFPTGVSTVVWRAIDNATNTSICAFTVTVTDNELPVVTCPPAATVAGSGSPCGFPANQLNTATASDNCAVTSLTSDAPTTLPAGPTLITWTAKDAANNQKTCAYVVTVNCGSAARYEVGSMKDEERYEVGGMKDEARTSLHSLIAHHSSLITHHLSLSPNPASDIVVVTLSNQQINSKSNQQPSGSNQQINNKSNQHLSASNQQLIIHDALGRQVWTKKLEAGVEQVKIDLVSGVFEDGVYQLSWLSENGIITKTLVVARR